MVKRPTLMILIAGLLLAISIMIIASKNPENRIRQSLNLLPNSQLVFEDSARFGGGASLKSLYYWTDSSLASVQEHYETMIGNFYISQDKGRDWLIMAFRIDGLQPKPNTSTSFLTHESFCPDSQDNSCVSVVILDYKQPEIYTMPIMSPSGFRRLTAPSILEHLGSRGTLIIYSYWIMQL